MRLLALLAVLAALACAGCGTSASDAANDLGGSIRGGGGRDTRGVSRRPDVDYGLTRPALPTITSR